MLDTIKKSMRISHDLLDDDIQLNIDTCLADLSRVGINTVDTDEIITKLCELYCKSQYDYLDKGEQYRKNYEAFRDSVSMCVNYQ